MCNRLKNKFAQRIAFLRKQNGLSQKNAAKSLGVSQALLSHYEKGIRECGLDFLIKASQVYCVSCDYLLGVSDNPSLPSQDINDDEIYADLVGKSTLLKGRREILQAINVLYAIVSKINKTKIHNDFNNILYSHIYQILRVLQICLSDKEDDIFKIPINKSTTCYQYLEVNSLTSLMKKLDEVNNKNKINSIYLLNEFPSSMDSLTNIIETVENSLLK